MQVTIITGASRGIGKAISEDLKSLGHVFINLSTKDADFEDFHLVNRIVRNTLRELKDIEQINIVLCAAQIGTFNYTSLYQFDKLYKINVIGNLAVIDAASEFEVKMRIVWFAGGGAAFPYPEFFGYSLSKVAVVRAVENFSLILRNTSIIALAPGAVETDMLKTIIENGSAIRTKTNISEPVNFVRKFITDEFDSISLNGMFLHVRDDVYRRKRDIYKLRRIE